MFFFGRLALVNGDGAALAVAVDEGVLGPSALVGTNTTASEHLLHAATSHGALARVGHRRVFALNRRRRGNMLAPATARTKSRVTPGSQGHANNKTSGHKF